MKNNQTNNLKGSLHYIFIAIPILIIIAVVYIFQLNQTISDNIEQNISDLAEHDLDSVMLGVKSSWQDLDNVVARFDVYGCKTLEDVEKQMNKECDSSVFRHMYMVAEEGIVYTENKQTYLSDETELVGGADLLLYFKDGEEHFVSFFSKTDKNTGKKVRYIMYGVRLEDFSVEGIDMTGLVGIASAEDIGKNLTIDSFEENGSGENGFVMDEQGNYVMGAEAFASGQEDFFDQINNSIKSDLSGSAVARNVKEGKSFQFFYTPENGERRLVYCVPFEETGVHWYFMLSLDQKVYVGQNKRFLTMSIGMFVIVVIMLAAVFSILIRSMRKVISVNATTEARSEFLANMSHEIRTPLHGIIGLLYLMKNDLEHCTDKRIIMQRLDKVTDTADYLLSLINNILDITKLQEENVELASNVLSMEMLVDDVWFMQKSAIQNKGITLTVQKKIYEPWFIGDEVAIKQVLMNILSNAAKFTPAGGSIDFSATQIKSDEHHVTAAFVCRDTGCGMGEEFLEHIWENFSQERNNNESSVKGTGLGMAITKRLVDAMGGDIRVESKQGEGTTFFVDLHFEIAKEPEEHYPEPQMETTPQPSKKKSLKIMVVEDNDLNAEILIEILENNGFEVVHAPDGKEAVEQFAASSPGEIGVILMDVKMPVMDGCEATRAIRAMKRKDAKKVAIFACTANNFSEDRELAEESGMDDFLAKPIDMKKLLQKLEKLEG